MKDKPFLANNPALKIQAANEKVMFGAPTENEPLRADIIRPGEDNSYSQIEKGGVASKPAPAKPVQTKSKPGSSAKPVSKKTNKTKKRVETAAQRSENLAKSVVSSFSDRLIKEAKANGGYLSVSDLEVLNSDFQEKASELKLAFEKSFEEYVIDHERKSWMNSRMRPFDRMIVKTFSHLLEDDSRRIKRSDHVSRRMLPGFFIALNLMLGADIRESYQGKCRAIVKLVGQRTGKGYDWDDIYDNEDARAITFDALVDIARNFSDLNKRREWFIDLINSHLETPQINPDGGSEIWTLTTEGFDEFFHALMSELRVAVSMEAGLSLITRRHDAEITANLVTLMEKLAEKKEKPTPSATS